MFIAAYKRQHFFVRSFAFCFWILFKIERELLFTPSCFFPSDFQLALSLFLNLDEEGNGVEHTRDLKKKIPYSRRAEHWFDVLCGDERRNGVVHGCHKINKKNHVYATRSVAHRRILILRGI